MDEKPSFRPFIFPTVLLSLGGWAGLLALLYFTQPTLWPRWGLFALVILAGTGTTLPISFGLNTLLPSTPPAAAGVILRQSLWVGVYLAVLTWLQIGRILNFSLGLWLAMGLITIEALLRWRETSARTPADVPPQPPLR